MTDDDIRDEYEYRRLKKELDRLPEERGEAFADMATKKTDHSGRGGYRGGVKPKLPDHLKREPVNARIQKWMIDSLKAEGPLGGDAGKADSGSGVSASER